MKAKKFRKLLQQNLRLQGQRCLDGSIIIRLMLSAKGVDNLLIDTLELPVRKDKFLEIPLRCDTADLEKAFEDHIRKAEDEILNGDGTERVGGLIMPDTDHPKVFEVPWPVNYLDGEWHNWAGGNQPFLDDYRVEVEFRDGGQSTDPASYFLWDHDMDNGDIVRFRYVKDGWLSWSGGKCPVKKKARVSVKYKNSVIGHNRKARDLDWHHSDEYHPDYGGNILFYRVIE